MSFNGTSVGLDVHALSVVAHALDEETGRVERARLCPDHGEILDWLHRLRGPVAGTGAFDERRVGLDHLAFRVVNGDELQRWVTHLDANAVTHSGIIDIGFGPTVVFRGPDNMQLEFFVHPGADELEVNAADSEEAQRVLQEVRLATDRE